MVLGLGNSSNRLYKQPSRQEVQQPGVYYGGYQSTPSLPPQYPSPPPIPSGHNFQLAYRPPPIASPPPANPEWTAYGPYQPPLQPVTEPRHGLNIKWASVANLRTAASRPAPLKSTVSLPAALTSAVNVAAAPVNSINSFTLAATGYMQQDVGLCDLLSSKFDSVISCIDEEVFSGDERDLVVHTYPSVDDSYFALEQQRSLSPSQSNDAQISSSNHFSKVWLYANSRLPPYLPPLKLYMSTYPLICLAAQYSERVYAKPNGVERENHIGANFRQGNKAMTLKSLPIDHMNTIVFAIRGSQSIMDWCVNYRTAPTSPGGFLDDPGNYCHTGFLGVARKTASIVAERLRTLLQENPGRSTASLLLCGHSAGGAVAQLLYAHMMSQSSEVKSDLKYLTSFFKRVHCVTFGAPPVSLLPLKQPGGKQNRKSLFFSFVNEGDPVVRADKAVVASLLKLYANPAPNFNGEGRNTAGLTNVKNCAVLGAAAVGLKGKTKASGKVKPPKGESWPSAAPGVSLPVWNIPPGTLSLAGRLVLLRDFSGASSSSSSSENVGDFGVSDEQIRTVVFGDPVKHMMRLYARRVEYLATKAVTAQGFG